MGAQACEINWSLMGWKAAVYIAEWNEQFADYADFDDCEVRLIDGMGWRLRLIPRRLGEYWRVLQRDAVRSEVQS